MKLKIKKDYYNSIFSLFVILMLILFIKGCSINRIIKKQNTGLTKNILITSFENQTFYDNYSINRKFQKTFVNAIKDTCPNILLTSSDNTEFSDNLPRLANNDIDNFTLAEIGRQLGVNAIITGALKNISSNKKEKGMWWFRKTRNFTQIQFNVEVYDTQTATKLIDTFINREVEIEESESTTIALKKNDELPAVNNALFEILYEIGENIGEAVYALPWKGYIKSITNNSIIISSGEKAGLAPGDIMEVFGNQTIFEGQNGHHFSGYGHKTGEIQIIKVYPESAEASLVSGNLLKIGNYIKPKP